MVWDELLPMTSDDEFAFTDFKIAQSLHLRDRVHVYCITRWCMKKRADSMYLVLKPLQWHCTSMAAATRASWLCPPLCTNACMWCKCTWYASYTTIAWTSLTHSPPFVRYSNQVGTINITWIHMCRYYGNSREHL